MRWLAMVTCCLTMVVGLGAPSGASELVISTSNAKDPVAGADDAGAAEAQGLLSSSRWPKPRPAAPIHYDRESLAALPAAAGGDDWHCLAEALYFEARGEGVRGIFAVAEVILNRVENPRFPSTVCAVVNQGTGKRYQCQFTYTCDGAAETIREKRAWGAVGKVARLMLDGAPRLLTGGATHYHTKAVDPRWASVFDRTSTIGVHHFYRMPG